MDHLLPWLRLQLTPNLGRVGLLSLIKHFKTPEKAIAAARNGWPKLPGLRHGLARLVPLEDAHIVQKACQSLDEMNEIGRAHV